MKTEPLIRQMKRAYRGSPVAALDKLMAEQSRWKRKVTIAQNKLAAVRSRIDTLASELAAEAAKGDGK